MNTPTPLQRSLIYSDAIWANADARRAADWDACPRCGFINVACNCDRPSLSQFLKTMETPDADR